MTDRHPTPDVQAPAPDDASTDTASDRSGTDRRPGRWPRRVALLAIGVLIAVLAAFGTRFGSDPTVVDSPLIGQRVPDVTLPYLEQDGELSLRSLEGQIVVVNFWASWCTACRAEHDDLMAASAAYKDEGVTFVGINYQDLNPAAVVFLDGLGRGYDHLDDVDSRAGIEFGVFGLPETFFIDADGTVVAKITGESSFDLLANTLDTILAGGTPSSVSRPGYESGPGG